MGPARERSIKRIGISVGLLLFAAAVVWGWRHWSASGRWSARPYDNLGIMVVDYTVPFENFREHAGFFWLLNHRKIHAPAVRQAQQQEKDPSWQLRRDYVGYRPDDREHPARLSHVDRSRAEVIYIADTYGVYQDDLKHIDTQESHMDYTTLVFGGLSDGDAHALASFASAGGLLLAEFNTFCEPTAVDQRHLMEDVFGVEWTEWVGRVFADPYDEGDVPHWLPREFARQFPGEELPHSPILLLVARDGRLMVFGGPSLVDVAPRVMMTAAGNKRFPGVAGDVPYYFWFSLMRARPDARVYATLRMPKIAGIPSLLARLGTGVEPVALTAHDTGKGRAIYFVGDFADIDFDPGMFDTEDAIADGAALAASSLSGMTTAPAFWGFYAPVMEQLLREAVAEHAAHAPARR